MHARRVLERQQCANKYQHDQQYEPGEFQHGVAFILRGRPP